MTRRTDLPSQARLHAALTRLRQTAIDTGKRPTVLALAREFGPSNTTFRRHFPGIARNIAEAARTSAPAVDTPTSHYDQLVTRNAKLKRAEQGADRPPLVGRRPHPASHPGQPAPEAAARSRHRCHPHRNPRAPTPSPLGFPELQSQAKSAVPSDALILASG